MSYRKRFSKKTARRVAKELQIDLKKIPFEEFYKGINVELEHGHIDPRTDVTGDDPILTGKIALAHLYQDGPRYYTFLEHMEELMKELGLGPQQRRFKK